MKFSVKFTDIIKALNLVSKDWEHAKMMSLDGGHYTFNLEFAEFYGAYRKLLKCNINNIRQDSFAIIDLHDFTILNQIIERGDAYGKANEDPTYD